MQDLLKEEKIYYAMKYGKNKANFVENKIGLIKRLLYIQLRDNLSQDWPKLLPIVVKNYNNTPLKHLGYLKPNDINSISDSLKVQKAQHENNIKVYNEPSFHEQIINQHKYSQLSKSFKLGDYVYADTAEKLFDKSFDIKVFSNFPTFLNKRALHKR